MGNHYVVEPLAETVRPTVQNQPKQRIKAVPQMWTVAASLRPNTPVLALACIAGDEEAIAIRDAYQFQTSRGTRCIVVEKDDPMFLNVTTFQEPGATASLSSDSPFPRVSESLQEIHSALNAAYQNFKSEPDAGQSLLWETIHLFARRSSEGYLQQSIRLAGFQGDLINEFTIHAMEKIQAGAYAEQSLFGNWLSVVFRNYANNQMNDLTRQKTKFESLVCDEEDESTENQSWQETDARGMGEKRLSWALDEELRSLSAPDQAYAALLMLGLNQKQAAVRMEESVPTARKRDLRIYAALTGQQVMRSAEVPL